jgi:hypothetical protein
MPALFDPSTDFEDVVDGLEAVTLVRRGTDNTEITHALQRALSTSEIAASDGRYIAGDVRWHIPEVEAVTAPRLGDQIEDAAGNRWTILARQLATLEHRWRLICRNVAIAYGLDTTVTILVADWSKGSGGAEEPVWREWRTGVRARIQEVAAEVTVEHEARITRRRVEVYIGTDLDIGHEHQVRGPDGTLYKVVGVRGKAELGGLQTISAEEVPWPLA